MIWIGIGGAIGAVVRYQIGKWFKNSFSRTLPFGTLFVNVTGSLLLGILMALHLDRQLQEVVWFMFGIGFCGAYTTFSTFGYETIEMLMERRIWNAILYVISSVIISFVFAWIGYSIL